MIKDIIIAGLVADKVIQISWFESSDSITKLFIWLASTVCLLFFYLFLEQMYEMWRRYRERLRRIEEIMVRLRYEKRKITGNSKTIGR